VADLLRPDDTRDALRKLGGLLFGIGILMLLFRKGESWDDGWVLILLAIPAALLYGGGVLTTGDTGGARPWQAVYSVFGLIFVNIALFQFIETVDGNTGSALNVAWIFGVTAALAFYAGFVKGIRFHLLAGSLALIVAWSAIWNEILGDEGIVGNIGTYRGLLGILAIILLGGALYAWRSAPEVGVGGTGVSDGGDHRLWRASELLTGAGVAAVIGCSLGIASLGAVLNPFSGQGLVVETSTLWDVLLLLVSLGLVAVGSTIGTRGPVYVGAIGLTLFLFIVGFDVNEGAEADPTNLGGWPIILLVLGGLGILLSWIKEASQGDKPRQFVNKLKSG
jgi:hypothetical protein